MARNYRSGFGKIALIAGALLSGLPAAVLAEENKPAPKVIDNFDYASHRNVPAIDGRCYEGQIFNYNLLSDGTIAQADKKRVFIRSLRYYDIDGDGKFGKAEIEARKKGIPIFMDEAFNNLADAEVERFLEKVSEYNSLEAQLKQSEKNAGTQKEDYERQLAEYKAKFDVLQKMYDELVKKEEGERKQISELEEKAKTQAPLDRFSQQSPQDLAKLPPKANNYDSTNSSDQTAAPIVQVQKPERDYRGVWLQAQQMASLDLREYVTSIAVRWNPFKEVDIGFEAGLDLGFGPDRQVSSYNDIITNNLSTFGSITKTNNFLIGPSFGMQFGPLFVDGGFDCKTWMEQSVAGQIKNGKTDKNSDTTPNRQIFGKIAGGFKIPFGKNFELGFVYKYSGDNTMSLGFRGDLKL